MMPLEGCCTGRRPLGLLFHEFGMMSFEIDINVTSNENTETPRLQWTFDWLKGLFFPAICSRRAYRRSQFLRLSQPGEAARLSSLRRYLNQQESRQLFASKYKWFAWSVLLHSVTSNSINPFFHCTRLFWPLSFLENVQYIMPKVFQGPDWLIQLVN
jgi:hypothetical protein